MSIDSQSLKYFTTLDIESGKMRNLLNIKGKPSPEPCGSDPAEC